MKLLGLGDNVFDAYLFRDELYPGGNAANVSVLARRIGAEYTGYLGVLADDPPGCHFLAALREESVEVSRVRIGVGKSACNYIVLDDHGDRTFSGNNGKETVQNLFSLHLTPQDLAYAAAFDVIHTSIHSGISNAVLGGLSRRADLSMDFSNDGFTHTNVAELAPILRFAFFSAGERSLEEVHTFAKYAADCGIPQVIFTMGTRGACGISQGQFWQADACVIQPVDALGAGDAFIAAFLYTFWEMAVVLFWRQNRRRISPQTAVSTMAPSVIRFLWRKAACFPQAPKIRLNKQAPVVFHRSLFTVLFTDFSFPPTPLATGLQHPGPKARYNWGASGGWRPAVRW